MNPIRTWNVRSVLWRASTVVAGLFVLAVLGWQVTKSRTFQVTGELVARVETHRPRVALTFDDGPRPEAIAELLPVLRRHGVRATFFLVGKELARFPELGAQLVAEGHELGNHSYTHSRMVFKSSDFIASEIERTDALILAAGQSTPIPFRPPHGVKGIGLPRYLAHTGRKTIMWDIEPESDSTIANDPDAIAEHVANQAKPGSIILLHVMFPKRRASMQSVESIITRLQGKGLQFVTVSELVESESKHDAVSDEAGS